MRTAVVTIVLGAAVDRWFDYTGPYMAEYASRIGAVLRVIDKSDFAGIHPWCAKYEIGRLLTVGGYDRVIYLDADVYVMPDCPSLFEIVPEANVGIYDHATPTDRWKFEREIRGFLAVTGQALSPEMVDNYSNDGVVVLSSSHAWLYKVSVEELRERTEKLRSNGVRWPEQTWLNGMLWFGKVPITRLSYRFNHRLRDLPTKGTNRMDSFMLHYDKDYIEFDAPIVAREATRRRML